MSQASVHTFGNTINISIAEESDKSNEILNQEISPFSLSTFRTTVLAGAISSVFIFSGGTVQGFSNAAVNQTWNYPVVSSLVSKNEGRLFINGREGSVTSQNNGTLRLENRSAISSEGPPYEETLGKFKFVMKAEASSKINSVSPSENVSIHFQSAYVKIRLMDGVLVKDNPFKELMRKVGTPFMPVVSGIKSFIPPFVTKSVSMANTEIKQNMVQDSAKLAVFSVLSSAFFSAFGWPFWIILGAIMFVALLEFLISLMKRFRLPGVDYSAIAKGQVFLVASLMFVAFSIAQIAVDVILWKTQGATMKELFENAPSWLGNLGYMVNIQTLGSLFIVGFYCNSIRKMFLKGAGMEQVFDSTPAS